MSKTLGDVTIEQMCELYRTMQLIRQTEEELARCHQQGLIHGACHTYVGQEAIAAGVCAHLTSKDRVFSTHRGHGHALAKGMPPQELIAELFGRVTGCSQGRGGSMHLFSPEIGMMGTSGIVGPCILQAAGGGYSAKLLGSDAVSVAFFGDGAVNNGAFHEGINLAAIWSLPVLFVCENNQFATEVPFSYSAANPTVASRTAAYGIPGFEIDGNDVLEVYRVAGEAVVRARAGQGPTLIECKTYRTRAHAEGMVDYTYRTREEVAQWRERCPISRLKEIVLETAVGEGREQQIAERLTQIDEEVARLVSTGREFAEDSPYPDGAAATLHVYAQPDVQPTPPPAPRGRMTTFVQATLEALDSAMARDARIFVMGEGIGKRGGNFMTTKGLYDKYGPERLLDTPICERGFVGLACGAGMTGSRPVVDFMFLDFILDSVGELVNQIAKMQYMSSGRLKMPLLLRGCIGIGHNAATHHSGNYYGMFGQVPGLIVAVPSTPYDAKGLIAHALRSNNPVLFLEHRELLQLKGPVPEVDYEIEFGKARIAREGRHITLVAIARMVHQVLAVCDQLERDGISVEVIDPRTVTPLDTATILESVAKTGRLLIVDEAPGHYGFSAEIAARVADAGFDYLDAPVRRLTGAFCPTPYSPPLENAVVPQPAEIAAAVRALAKE
jgi:2-oxoisovalerate dehydrogenase E1 component